MLEDQGADHGDVEAPQRCQLIDSRERGRFPPEHEAVVRTLADAAVTPTSFGKPAAVSGVLNTHAKGSIQSWSELPGIAVTAPEYGTAIMTLYGAIATWVTAHPVPKPKPKPASRHKAPSAQSTSHRVLLR